VVIFFSGGIMIRDNFFKIGNEFMDDVKTLNASAIKIFMLLRTKIREAEGESNSDSHWVKCSYAEIMNVLGTKSHSSISSGIEQLISNGWIQDFKRGYYNKVDNVKESNSYLVPDRRIIEPETALLYRYKRVEKG
jgi:hypothetical protein